MGLLGMRALDRPLEDPAGEGVDRGAVGGIRLRGVPGECARYEVRKLKERSFSCVGFHATDYR